MCAFNADWKGCAFKCLTTCTEGKFCFSFVKKNTVDFEKTWLEFLLKTNNFIFFVAEKCQSFDEQAHIDAIKKSAEENRAELAAKVEEWNKQVADWKAQATKCLEEKVSKMLPMTYCG